MAAPRVLGFRASRKPRRKGMEKGAAAPPFPCLFCSRTDRISVLTGQGRSSSCKIWEAYIQSHVNETFPYTSILLPSGFRSLDGRTLAELLFVAESMWVGEHDMKGHFHPSFRFVKAKRYNAKPHVLIELDGETLADINGRSKYYEGFSRCVDRKPEEGAWIEPTEFGMMFLSILDLGMSEEEAEKIGIPITQTWKRISRSRY